MTPEMTSRASRHPLHALLLVLFVASWAACDDTQTQGGDRDGAADTVDTAGDTGADDTDDDPEGGNDTADDAAKDILDDASGDGDAGTDANQDAPSEDADVASDPPGDIPVEDATDGAADTDAGPIPCHASDDCGESQMCLEPDGFAGCESRVAVDPEDYASCDDDNDCNPLGDHSICELFPEDACVSNDFLHCVEGCEDSDACPEDQFCAPAGDFAHRCIPGVCLGDESCPDNFSCRTDEPPWDDEGNPRCFRTICESPEDCPDGECVNGFCYEAAGTCELPRM